MIEVCVSNGQRFFFHGTENDLAAAVDLGVPIKVFANKTPGETSRVWFILPDHIVAFSDVAPPGEMGE